MTTKRKPRSRRDIMLSYDLRVWKLMLKSRGLKGKKKPKDKKWKK